MRAAWTGLEFRVLDFKDTGTYILGGIDEVQACQASAINHQRMQLTLPFFPSCNALVASPLCLQKPLHRMPIQMLLGDHSVTPVNMCTPLLIELRRSHIPVLSIHVTFRGRYPKLVPGLQP